MRGPSAQTGRRLAQARALHQSGKVKAALAAYREVLRREPRNFDALCLLTMAQVQVGRTADAAKTIARALEVRPDSALALNAQGNVRMAQGRNDAAARSFAAAVAAEPGFAAARLNLGHALAAAGRREAALAAFDDALAAKPDWPEAVLARATQLAALGRESEALAGFEAALGLSPGLAAAHYNRGLVLKKLERLEEAAEAFQFAIDAAPDFAEAHNNLANTLTALRHYDAAIPAYRAALKLRPDYPMALYNLGNALVEIARHDEAIECFAQALRLDPGYAAAGQNLGSAKLAQGRWEEGWADYEYRLRDDDFRRRNFGADRVDRLSGDVARDLAGKAVLLYQEQGLGDEIMFASMVPDAARAAGRLALVCEPRLKGLFARSFPTVTVLAKGEAEPAWVERRYMIGSLGRLLRSRAEDFAGRAYLVPDPARVEAFRARLDILGPGRKLGVMWRGGVGGHSEKQRSLALGDMAAAMDPAHHWISLSHLPGAVEDIAACGRANGLAVHHWPEVLQSRDYDDTAALLAALDGVFTVTCTIGHCCGALGVPVHVLVPRAPEWRYGTAGDTIPWYGSMTLYRQGEDGAWPFAEAARALSNA